MSRQNHPPAPNLISVCPCARSACSEWMRKKIDLPPRIGCMYVYMRHLHTHNLALSKTPLYLLGYALHNKLACVFDPRSFVQTVGTNLDLGLRKAKTLRFRRAAYLNHTRKRDVEHKFIPGFEYHASALYS